MIKENSKKIKIMLLIAALAAIAAGFFRAFLLVNYIEPESGFYVSGNNMDTAFNWVIVAIVAIVAVCGFAVRKVKVPEFLDSRSTVVVFTSALCAFMYVSVFLYGLYMIFSASGNRNYFLFAQVVLCIPCCLNHISVCSNEIREKNKPHALFAMSEAVFFAIRTVEVFMDTDSQINVSQRSLELLMLCSMMLFFLFEANFLVENEELNMKNLSKYLMSGVATVAFPIIAVLPYLAVSLFWCYESNFLVMDVLECCIMMFAASRIMTLHD